MTEQAIEVFLTVAQRGTLSDAAQALFISQPAVSRHIRSLEEELGCSLMVRGKGKRRMELTEQGREFIQVAEKWRQVWQEAREVASVDRKRKLNVASVGSVSTYLLPPVFRAFLEEDSGRLLTFHSAHSREAYDMVAEGLADVALISDDIYHPQVETVPAFRMPMVLLAGEGSDLPERVHPSQLDARKELRLPWNPEYDMWHSFWFPSGVAPRAELGQMSLLEEYLSWPGSWSDSWVIAPYLVAEALSGKRSVRSHTLEEGPPDEVIYYLLGRRRKQELTEIFFTCLDRELRKYPRVESYLGAPRTGNPGGET